MRFVGIDFLPVKKKKKTVRRGWVGELKGTALGGLDGRRGVEDKESARMRTNTRRRVHAHTRALTPSFELGINKKQDSMKMRM